MLNETLAADPEVGGRVLDRWMTWHATYARMEVARLLPELSIRWPGDRARWKQKDERRRLDRWCSDGEDILNCIGVLSLDGDLVRKKLRLQKDRFARLTAALVALGAIRVWSDGRMHATAGGAYVRDALRARWLGEGSDAPAWIDPLPYGCAWKQASVRDGYDNR